MQFTLVIAIGGVWLVLIPQHLVVKWAFLDNKSELHSPITLYVTIHLCVVLLSNYQKKSVRELEL
jgi:hypothetical protein